MAVNVNGELMILLAETMVDVDIEGFKGKLVLRVVRDDRLPWNRIRVTWLLRYAGWEIFHGDEDVAVSEWRWLIEMTTYLPAQINHPSIHTAVRGLVNQVRVNRCGP